MFHDVLSSFSATPTSQENSLECGSVPGIPVPNGYITVTEFRGNIFFNISCKEGYHDVGFNDVVCAQSNSTAKWEWTLPHNGPKCDRNAEPTNASGKTSIIQITQ